MPGALRWIAPKLAFARFAAAAQIVDEAPIARTLAEARSVIVSAGYARVEYLNLWTEDDLAPMLELDRPARLLAAAWLGATWSINNVKVRRLIA